MTNSQHVIAANLAALGLFGRLTILGLTFAPNSKDKLDLGLFIARRLAFAKGQNASRVIIRIATAAVALSVSVMICASAFISGFKQEIGRKIFEFWGHIHISNAESALSSEPKPLSLKQDFYPHIDTLRSAQIYVQDPYNPERYRLVRSKGGVRHIHAAALKPGIIRTRDAMEGIVLKGLGVNYAWDNLTPYLTEGRAIKHGAREVILSRQTADRLRISLGDRIVIHFVRQGEQLRRAFNVCGIYKTGLEEYDRKYALAELGAVQELLGWSDEQIGVFEIWLDDLRDIDLYADYIAEMYYDETQSVETVRERARVIFEWLQLQDYNEMVIIGLMLAVAIINMITALLVLVLERVEMIGILKALGANNSLLRRLFLYQAGLILLRGMFWGNLIAVGVCYLQDKYRFIRLNEADYYLSYAPVNLTWSSVALINIGALLIVAVFLLIPALTVAGITPLRAIRFK